MSIINPDCKKSTIKNLSQLDFAKTIDLEFLGTNECLWSIQHLFRQLTPVFYKNLDYFLQSQILTIAECRDDSVYLDEYVNQKRELVTALTLLAMMNANGYSTKNSIELVEKIQANPKVVRIFLKIQDDFLNSGFPISTPFDMTPEINKLVVSDKVWDILPKKFQQAKGFVEWEIAWKAPVNSEMVADTLIQYLELQLEYDDYFCKKSFNNLTSVDAIAYFWPKLSEFIVSEQFSGCSEAIYSLILPWFEYNANRITSKGNSFTEVVKVLLKLPPSFGDFECPVTYAMNHSHGILTQACINWWFNSGRAREAPLPEQLTTIFEKLITTNTGSEVITTLAMDLMKLYFCDSVWIEEHLLPYLEVPPRNHGELLSHRSISCWCGFLYSGRMTKEFFQSQKASFINLSDYFDQLEFTNERVDFKGLYANTFSLVVLDTPGELDIKQRKRIISILSSSKKITSCLEFMTNRLDQEWFTEKSSFWPLNAQHLSELLSKDKPLDEGDAAVMHLVNYCVWAEEHLELIWAQVQFHITCISQNPQLKEILDSAEDQIKQIKLQHPHIAQALFGKIIGGNQIPRSVSAS